MMSLKHASIFKEKLIGSLHRKSFFSIIYQPCLFNTAVCQVSLAEKPWLHIYLERIPQADWVPYRLALVATPTSPQPVWVAVRDAVVVVV